VVDLADIPDFDGPSGSPLPGQRPKVGDPSAVTPLAVVLVACPLDREYRNIALNAAAVDAFIQEEITATRAYATTVERWSPWSDLQVELPYATATRYNYARFTVGERSWYGFLDASYLNLDASLYTVTPDVWTTYGPTIGYSTVLRGHVAVAASSGGDTSYCLEPEDFSPGDLIGYASYLADPLGTPRVLVISTTDLRANPFVPVDSDTGDTTGNPITQTLATGVIDAPDPTGGQTFSYAVGSNSYDDEFYYPYATGAGSQMQRPRAVGATPSTVDGIGAEGGAFIYPSVGAAVTHLSRLAHAPWIADGIQRVLLIPGGSGGGLAPTNLSPTDSIGSFAGAPTYSAAFTTEIDTTVQLTSDWTNGLPAAYDQWTKLRTGPFSAVQIADRLGASSEFDPQEIVGLGALTLALAGVFHPEADVAAWIVGAGGSTAEANPMRVPVAVDMAHYAVGRDSVLGGQAAGLSAERSQSVVDLILAMQKAVADRSFTLGALYTASQYAIAEAI
jgi:hypothetical protein